MATRRRDYYRFKKGVAVRTGYSKSNYTTQEERKQKAFGILAFVTIILLATACWIGYHLLEATLTNIHALVIGRDQHPLGTRIILENIYYVVFWPAKYAATMKVLIVDGHLSPWHNLDVVLFVLSLLGPVTVLARTVYNLKNFLYTNTKTSRPLTLAILVAIAVLFLPALIVLVIWACWFTLSLLWAILSWPFAR